MDNWFVFSQMPLPFATLAWGLLAVLVLVAILAVVEYFKSVIR